MASGSGLLASYLATQVMVFGFFAWLLVKHYVSLNTIELLAVTRHHEIATTNHGLVSAYDIIPFSRDNLIDIAHPPLHDWYVANEMMLGVYGFTVNKPELLRSLNGRTKRKLLCEFRRMGLEVCFFDVAYPNSKKIVVRYRMH